MKLSIDQLANHEMPVSSVRSRFGNYRAEWFKSEHDFVELFVEPEYFPELSDESCSLLIGRRGTGKTSALRGLSYGSVHERDRWVAGRDQIGLYHKFDLGVVGAMTGAPLSEEEWSRIFGHYLNLISLSMALTFLDWLARNDIYKSDGAATLSVGNRSLGADATDLAGLGAVLSDRLFELASSINAVGSHRAEISSTLTTTAAVAASAAEALLVDIGAVGRTKVFYLLDELETLSASQQRVVNTIIKQANESYAVKVCSKERGWKTRATIVPDQVLSAPADYSLIDIDLRLSQGQAYAGLAERICRKRLGTLLDDRPLPKIFPKLSSLEEAKILGLDPDSVESDLRSIVSNRFRLDAGDLIDELDSLDQYVLVNLFRKRGGVGPGGGKHAVLTERVLSGKADVKQLRSLISNYRIPALHTIKPSTRGDRRIFSGWRSLVLLSGGTIRQLMQTIEWAVASAEQNSVNQRDGQPIEISVNDQHFATRQVADINLREIRSFSPAGAELYNLALGIGQFQSLLLRNAFSHAPDLNQFVIEDSLSNADLQYLIDRAVMEGVFLRKRRTKRSGPEVIPTDEYRLHPVLAPYFPFNPTEKRAYRILPEEFFLLSRDPQRGLASLAVRYEEAADPEQQLF